MTPKIRPHEKKERSRNFTETEKWNFVGLFEPHKEVLLSPLNENKVLKRYIWQNIADQLNVSQGNLNEPWSVLQLQQLWKNLARRAKSRPQKVKELIGCDYDNVEESPFTQLDVKVLTLLDSYAAINPAAVTNNNNNTVINESYETSNSGEILTWDNAISVIKTEQDSNEIIFVQPSSSSVDGHSDNVPLPVEKTAQEFVGPPNVTVGELSSIPRPSRFDSNPLQFDYYEEKRSILLAERLKIEAKMKQIELKNKRLETEIEANVNRNKLIGAEIEANLAKKCKYDEEAKYLKLKNLQLMQNLKNDGFAFNLNSI